MRIIVSLLCIFLLLSLKSFSQNDASIVGFQFKPIFPMSFLGTGKITNDADSVHFETLLSSGFSSGLIVRHNFTKLIAFETGISYAKRIYKLTITDGNFTDQSEFRAISYEIPAVIMVFAQVADKIFVSGSLGPQLDMFASSLKTTDPYFQQVAFRNHVFLPAIIGNLGCELRTEKSGIVYFGFSFQRPFSFIYLSKIGYTGTNKYAVVQNELSGTYLTIDLRYYLPPAHPLPGRSSQYDE